MKAHAEIYFSYAWNPKQQSPNTHEELIDRLYNSLAKDGFKVVKDKHDLEYNGSIDEFIKRLSRADCIIVAISDKYLKSTYCMYELCEIARQSHYDREEFRERVLPIRLESIDFKDPRVMESYIQYWRNELARWDETTKNNPGNLAVENHQRHQRIKDIAHYFGKLTEWLADSNMLSTQQLSSNDFADIKEAINKKNPTGNRPVWRLLWGNRTFRVLAFVLIAAVIGFVVILGKVAKWTSLSGPAAEQYRKLVVWGSVSDGANGALLPYSDILLYDEEGSIIWKEKTDSSGYFIFSKDSVTGTKVAVGARKQQYTGNKKQVDLPDGNTQYATDSLYVRLELVRQDVAATDPGEITTNPGEIKGEIKKEDKKKTVEAPTSVKTDPPASKSPGAVIDHKPEPDVVRTRMCKITCLAEGVTGEVLVTIFDPENNASYAKKAEGHDLVFDVPCEVVNQTFRVRFTRNGVNEYRNYRKTNQFEIVVP